MKKIILGTISLFCLCSILFLSGCNKEYVYSRIVIGDVNIVCLDCKRNEDMYTIYTKCPVNVNEDVIYCCDYKIKGSQIIIYDTFSIKEDSYADNNYSVEWEFDELVFNVDNYAIYKKVFS